MQSSYEPTDFNENCYLLHIIRCIKPINISNYYWTGFSF